MTATAALVRRSGDVTFSMPDVAAESGVALRTLYRYFPKRQDLVDALATVSDQAAGRLPESVDEIESWLIEAWHALLDDEALLRAQHLGPAGAEVRRSRAAHHRVATVGLVNSLDLEIDQARIDDIVDVALLVSSSTAMFEYLDVLGIDVERGARLAAKTIGLLIEDAASTSPEAPGAAETGS